MKKLEFDYKKECEDYDKTLIDPFKRTRIDITLPNWMLRQLKEESKKTGKPISRMVEEKFTK